MIIATKILIGLFLAFCMFLIKPLKHRWIMNHAKKAEILSHAAVGFYSYWLIPNIAICFLIFVLIEAIQKLFCKRGFGYNDIFYSMMAVTILYSLKNIFLWIYK